MRRQQEEIVSSGDGRLKYVQNALRCLEAPVPLMFPVYALSRGTGIEQCHTPNTGKPPRAHMHTLMGSESQVRSLSYRTRLESM